MKKRFQCLLGLILIVSLSGCTYRYGMNPHTERLNQLRPGESTAGDILLVLGEPRGYGQTRFNPELELRQIWFYEYLETDGKKVDIKMLLVFLDEQVYDGHMWFASSSLIQENPK